MTKLGERGICFRLGTIQKLRKKLSDMNIDNLPGKEFRVLIIKMIQELRWRMYAQSDKLVFLNKELENIKNNEIELKDTITE